LLYKSIFSGPTRGEENDKDDDEETDEQETDEQENDDDESLDQANPDEAPPTITVRTPEVSTTPPSTRMPPKIPPINIQAPVVSNENKWTPLFSSHTYRSGGYDRIQYLIDVPSCFSGKKGTYKLAIEKNGTELTLTVPYNHALTDPHHVHSWLTEKYGRLFSVDSSKINNWKESTKAMQARSSDKREIMGVFRDKTKFCVDDKVADDLPHRGVLLSTFDLVNPKTGEMTKAKTLIIELKSVEKIEDSDSEEEEDLELATFKSPEKLRGVSGGETSQLAMVLEALASSGITLDHLQKGKPKRTGQDDAMDVDGAWKRTKPAGPKTTGEGEGESKNDAYSL
jgi:hypothetical protein